jgi:hypothetical protein
MFIQLDVRGFGLRATSESAAVGESGATTPPKPGNAGNARAPEKGKGGDT